MCEKKVTPLLLRESHAFNVLHSSGVCSGFLLFNVTLITWQHWSYRLFILACLSLFLSILVVIVNLIETAQNAHLCECGSVYAWWKTGKSIITKFPSRCRCANCILWCGGGDSCWGFFSPKAHIETTIYTYWPCSSTWWLNLRHSICRVLVLHWEISLPLTSHIKLLLSHFCISQTNGARRLLSQGIKGAPSFFHTVEASSCVVRDPRWGRQTF